MKFLDGFGQAVGVSLEGSELKIAQVSRRRGRLSVKLVRRTYLNTEDDSSEDQEAAAMEEAFAGTGATARGAAEDSRDWTGAQWGREGDPLDGAASAAVCRGDEDDEEDIQAQVVAALVASVDGFSCGRVAVNVPEANVFYHLMPWDYGLTGKSLGKRARQELDAGEGGLGADDIGWSRGQDGTVLVAARVGGCALAEAAVTAGRFVESREIRVVSAVPDEFVLADLVRRLEGPAAEDEVIVVVHVGDESTRVVLVAGGRVLRVAPVIHEVSDSAAILRTVVSRILLAQDESSIKEIARIVLSGAARWIGAADLLTTEFVGVKVSYLDLSELEMSDGVRAEGPEEFAVPIGLAWSLLDEPPADGWVDLLPEEIRVRNSGGLAWHGVLATVATGMGVGWLVVSGMGHLGQEDALRSQAREIEKSLVEIAPAARASVEAGAEAEALERSLDRLSRLQATRYRWSELLVNSARHYQEIGSSWITSVHGVAGENIEIQGLSTRRTKVPALAGGFDGLSLQAVNEATLRGRKVYRYELNGGGDGSSWMEKGQGRPGQGREEEKASAGGHGAGRTGTAGADPGGAPGGAS